MARECPKCDGDGWVGYFVGDGPSTDRETCDKCGGSGEIDD